MSLLDRLDAALGLGWPFAAALVVLGLALVVLWWFSRSDPPG